MQPDLKVRLDAMVTLCSARPTGSAPPIGSACSNSDAVGLLMVRTAFSRTLWRFDIRAGQPAGQRQEGVA